MKKVLFTAIVLTFITYTGIAQNRLDRSKISPEDGVLIRKLDQSVSVTYTDISEQAKGKENTFTMSKLQFDSLNIVITQGFDQMPEQPVIFKLDNDELRMYFRKKRSKQFVEIVHENTTSEATGTLTWLTRKDVRKIFSTSTN